MNDQKTEQCANGKVGYDISTGKAYNVRPPCSQQARPGHIYCERCRVEAGGSPR
jgi:hypothetical protein